MNQVPTYLINLARSHNRKVAMQEQLAHFPQLDLIIVSAIDGAMLNEADLHTTYNSEKAMQYLYRDMTLPEIGCALSHIACYRQLLASNAPFALILEDDVIIETATIFSETDAISTIMNDTKATILLCTPDVVVKQSGKQQLSKNVTIAKYFSGVCAAGYIINKAAARYLVDHHYPVYHPADLWRLLRDNPIAIWALTQPAIAFHPVSKISTIEKSTLKHLKPKRQKTLGESAKHSLHKLHKKLGLKLGWLKKNTSTNH